MAYKNKRYQLSLGPVDESVYLYFKGLIEKTRGPRTADRATALAATLKALESEIRKMEQKLEKKGARDDR